MATTTNNSINNNAPLIGALQYYSTGGSDTTYPDQNWLKCDGSIVSQATYSTLFSRIGLINQPGTNWTSRNSTTSTLLSSLWGNNLYLAAGTAGRLISSTDGITWNLKKTGFNSEIRALSYGSGIYLYGGTSGGYATSTDAITFRTKNPSLNYIGYNGSVFIGALSDGCILSSTDFFTWNTTADLPGCNGIAYGNGVFVAVFNEGQIFSSTDGVTWTSRTSGSTAILNKINFINSIFIVSQVLTNVLLTSTDAITWTPTTPAGSVSNVNVISYGLGNYYIWKASSNATSTDLVTWGGVPGSPGVVLTSTSNGTIIVNGQASGVIRTSTDGSTWTVRTSQTTSNIISLIWSGSLFVYGDANGGIGTSTDGITWTAQTSGTTSAINTLIYDGALYHASVFSSTFTSTDAINWAINPGYTGTLSTVNSIIFAGGLYVLAGQGGVLKTSTDGITWFDRTSGTTSNINTMTYGGVYMYAGDGGVLSTSTDAITWNSQNSGTTSSIFSSNYNGSVYLYGGANGTLASSTDGVTWTPRISNTTSSINGLTSFNGFSVYTAPGPNLGSSTDGITWYPRVKANSSAVYNTITNGGPQFVTGGNNGLMETSPTDYSYDASINFQLPTDNKLAITQEDTNNFFRSLYIKAL